MANKLIHYNNKQNFEQDKDSITDHSIVFIQDTKEISTHGTVYKTVNWSVLDGPELITFTISHITENTYQAEEGMTWEEWISSEYNIDGYIINYNRVYTASNSTYYVDGVSSSAVIINNHLYVSARSHGSDD